MDFNRFSAVVNQYMTRFDEIFDPEQGNEGYKWRAVRTFQEHWDVDAEDFALMFRKATADVGNLMDSRGAFSRKALFDLLEMREGAEFLRGCFRDLFQDDGGNLEVREERMNHFIETVNSGIKGYLASATTGKQDARSALCYLTLWRPEQNWFYRYTEADDWVRHIGFGYDIGSGRKFSLANYYALCEEIRQRVAGTPELRERVDAVRDSWLGGLEDDYRILVYDLMMTCNRLKLYDEAGIPPLSGKSLKLMREIRGLEEQIRREETTQRAGREKLRLPDPTGHRVKHWCWGEGEVQACTGDTIRVQFQRSVQEYPYPDTLKKSILTIDIEGYLDRLNDLAVAEKKLEEAGKETQKKRARLENRRRQLRELLDAEEKEAQKAS